MLHALCLSLKYQFDLVKDAPVHVYPENVPNNE